MRPIRTARSCGCTTYQDGGEERCAEHPIPAPDAPESPWNRRFVAYATAHRETPDAMLEADEVRFPGGRMAGFITWIRQQWHAWATETGHPRARDANWPMSMTDHAAFDAWLAVRADELCRRAA